MVAPTQLYVKRCIPSHATIMVPEHRSHNSLDATTSCNGKPIRAAGRYGRNITRLLIAGIQGWERGWARRTTAKGA